MLNAGESLIESWLKHINNCQVVQKNWKPSKSWETISDKEIERLLKYLDKKFKVLSGKTYEQFYRLRGLNNPPALRRLEEAHKYVEEILNG